MKNISRIVSLILLFAVLILSVACQIEVEKEVDAEADAEVGAEVYTDVNTKVNMEDNAEADLDEKGDITMLKTENSQLTYFLLPPETEGTISVEQALYTRRSRRNFNNTALQVEQLSQILWSAYGISDGNRLRTSPSAGALYPLEIYVVIGNVTGIEPGVYKYDSNEHKIIKTIDGDIREELSAAALNQRMVNEAPITVVYIAVFDRITERYGERGRDRYVFMEIGHSAQNVYLQAEALGLGTCAIGAFADDSVSQLLDLPADEVPLYMMPVGNY